MRDHSFPEYNQFRTGYTFREIRKMLSREQKIKYAMGVYMFVTRATVLGRWHQIKKQMYNEEEKLFIQLSKSSR